MAYHKSYEITIDPVEWDWDREKIYKELEIELDFAESCMKFYDSIPPRDSRFLPNSSRDRMDEMSGLIQDRAAKMFKLRFPELES